MIANSNHYGSLLDRPNVRPVILLLQKTRETQQTLYLRCCFNQPAKPGVQAEGETP